MVLCKYYQRGNCKFGARCSYEHAQTSSTNNHSGGAFGSSADIFTSANTKAEIPKVADITEPIIKVDLTTERPLWPFSSYCPIKYGSANLLKEQDLSFEELRLSAYEALGRGAGAQHEQEVNARANSVNSIIQNILQNLQEAVKSSQSANSAAAVSTTNDSTGPFGNTSQNATNSFLTGSSGTFGSQSGNSANPFSTVSSGSNSLFGQAQQSSNSSFGQRPQLRSTSFGQNSQISSPFAAISPFGQSNQSAAFGSTSNLVSNNATSAFGGEPKSIFGTTPKPSTLGAPAQLTSIFGSTSNPSSAFGVTSQPASAFGTVSQPQSAFGTISQPSTLR